MDYLPSHLTETLAGYTWRRVAIGKSTASTFRLERRGGPTYYLKQNSVSPGTTLREERNVLDWLQGKLPVPQVVAFVEDRSQEYLLTSALPGHDAASLGRAFSRRDLVVLLGQGLRVIHSLPYRDCPFGRSLEVEIAAARRNTALGLVQPADYDTERLGMKADELLAELLAKRPAQEDSAFTHGDYCLPNVIIRRGQISGFVDWGRAGVGDPYRDIALAVRSTQYNLGPGYEQTFFDAYGLSSPDWAKIGYFMLLDEFF